jgi:hypothetical protein
MGTLEWRKAAPIWLPDAILSVYSPHHPLPHAEYFAGFPAFILSGKGPAGLAAQFAAHSLTSCNVGRSCAVSYNDAGSDRAVQALLYCTVATNCPALTLRPSPSGVVVPALRWQIHWNGLRTAVYGLLLPSQRTDGTPASLSASMVSGLRWSAKRTLRRPVHTSIFSVPRHPEKFCAAIRNIPPQRRRHWGPRRRTRILLEAKFGLSFFSIRVTIHN